MEDLFFVYELVDKDYNEKNYKYEMMKLYQLEILDYLYRDIREIHRGVDLMCLDNMGFEEYIKYVSHEYLMRVKGFLKELKELKEENKRVYNLREEIKNRFRLYSNISYSELLKLLNMFNVNFEIGNGILNIQDYSLSMIVSDSFNLADDNGNVKDILEWILGLEGCSFIRFYINYQNYNKCKLGIEEVYSLYKKTCINR